MGLDDLKKKAEGVVSSEKAEAVSDKVLDTAAAAAKKVTGGKFDSKIDSARDAADKAIGNE
ncbi:Rv0909 family putative TA system antitoxin [Actinomyces qiguomingii]|uniref:Rv0909 family putative TA system antitoxin n=1 Tax=Actinomyces qiguomingii TaxID=2057800 RepID=UPI000CA0277E|nr:Rv0909 family putative TA system antitoxin [Actinomyces qiguomingii]